MKFRSKSAGFVFASLAVASGLTVMCTASSAEAAKGFVAGPHYFYPLAQTAGDKTFAYQIPECAVLSDADFKKLKRNCKQLAEGTQECSTEKTVTLKTGSPASQSPTGTPNKKVMKEAQKVDESTKTFKLDYIVFISKDECTEARENELGGE